MKKYDESQPIVSLHIPKCAGQSLLSCLSTLGQQKFNAIFYYPEIGLDLPSNWAAPKTILHGHFVRWKGFPVEEICAGASQFTTVLRNPFDVIVSGYFYGLQNNFEWATNNSLDDFMDWWLYSGNRPITGALLNENECKTVANYAERFLLIGVAEHLNAYVGKLGDLLGAKLPVAKVVNASKYIKQVPDRKAEFRAAMPFEFELYEHILSQYE